MPVVVVFLEVLVIVYVAVSASMLIIAVSEEVAMLVPIKLFHIGSVLSLSPALFQSPTPRYRAPYFDYSSNLVGSFWECRGHFGVSVNSA